MQWELLLGRQHPSLYTTLRLVDDIGDPPLLPVFSAVAWWGRPLAMAAAPQPSPIPALSCAVRRESHLNLT